MMAFSSYHDEVFRYLNIAYRKRLRWARHDKPFATRTAAFLSRLSEGREYSGQDAWEICNEYLETIEGEMAKILHKHSVFFWIHLYRRIGVFLLGEMEDRKDAHTVRLVREILEVAISKYGALDRDDDVALSSTVHFKDILGGHYQRLLLKLYGSDEATRKFRALAEAQQWVLTKFVLRDFFDIYRAERYAYEYWRVTALMRAVGKGSAFARGQGDWPERIESLELSRLIISYDERILRMPLTTSLVGSWFAPSIDPTQHDSIVFLPYYNAERVDASGPLERFGVKPTGKAGFITNFLVGVFDVLRFRDAHKFLTDAFRKQTGTSLDAYLLCFWALANYALFPPRVLFREHREWPDFLDPGGPMFANLLNLLQRAYICFGNTVPGLAEEILFRAEIFESKRFDYTRADVEVCVGQLTLSEQKRDHISLWSGGRRFPLIPFGQMVVIDLLGIPSLLQTMFYKVQYEPTPRGSVFEEAFREALKAERFEYIYDGKIQADNGEVREIDASVRIGDTLFLFECRSIERPLDFEIGQPKTFKKRQEFLDEKIDQALTLREFIFANPTGRNYDFSWAHSICTFVVSPFIEWIWQLSPRLWHDDNKPRIMQADEAIAYLHEVASTAPD